MKAGQGAIGRSREPLTQPAGVEQQRQWQQGQRQDPAPAAFPEGREPCGRPGEQACFTCKQSSHQAGRHRPEPPLLHPHRQRQQEGCGQQIRRIETKRDPVARQSQHCKAPQTGTLL